MDAKEIAERIVELNQQCIDWNLAPAEGATECLKQSARYMEVAKLAPALAAAYLAEREEREALGEALVKLVEEKNARVAELEGVLRKVHLNEMGHCVFCNVPCDDGHSPECEIAAALAGQQKGA